MFKKSIDNALGWIERQMLSFDGGYWGVYERLRTDIHQRTPLCRPDTASEYLKVLQMYEEVYGGCFSDKKEKMLRWLTYAQNTNDENGNTAFPFALLEGVKSYECDKCLYQNDNGKIIINLWDMFRLSGDERYKSIALSCADFWAGIQRDDGCFHRDDVQRIQPYPEAMCFVTWMMAAMYVTYSYTNDERFLVCGDRAFSFVKRNIKQGRVLSSYETGGTEKWRPVSSDCYIALLCFCRSYEITRDAEFLRCIEETAPFLDELLDSETGAVLNCTESTADITNQGNHRMSDLVYTDGFAINALIEAYRILGEKSYLDKAVRLGKWLESIQLCEGEPLYDGAWRGSYHLDLKTYYGRCGNSADEGGVYSIYTGWSTLPIVMGMLKIQKAISNGE